MLEVDNRNVKYKPTPTTTVALDACGDNVMLTLRDVNGVKFRQALNARDAGGLLDISRSVLADPVFICDGDLEARRTQDDRGLTLKWPHEGNFGLVHLTGGETILFMEALKVYSCRLMRSPREDQP